MTQQEKRAVATELRAKLQAHDAAAFALMREGHKHLLAASNIERELEQFERPRKRTDARVAA